VPIEGNRQLFHRCVDEQEVRLVQRTSHLDLKRAENAALFDDEWKEHEAALAEVLRRRKGRR
jgi:hypothetical protein